MVDSKQTRATSRFNFRRLSPVPFAATTRRSMRRHEIVLHLPKARNRRHFFRVLALLHEHIPLRHPVVVHTSKWLSAANGLCSLRDGRRYRRKERLIPDGPFFHIAICSSLSDDAAAKCLMHEWAHGMVWTKQYDRKIARAGGSGIEAQRAGHGPEWGVAFSRAYCVFEFDILPRLRREDAKREREKVRSASKLRSGPKTAAERSSLHQAPQHQANSPTRFRRSPASSAGSSRPRRFHDRGRVDEQSQKA